jgi:hypothetical protein
VSTPIAINNATWAHAVTPVNELKFIIVLVGGYGRLVLQVRTATPKGKQTEKIITARTRNRGPY